MAGYAQLPPPTGHWFGGMTAAAALGGIGPDEHRMVISLGQFSTIDVLKATLALAGPSHVCVSTWTFGVRDRENVGTLSDAGSIKSLRLMVDRRFPKNHPEECARLIGQMSLDSIRIARTHAKMLHLHGGRFPVTVHGSANLNRNSNYEQWSILTDDATGAFVREFFDMVWREYGEGLDTSAQTAASARFMAERARLTATEAEAAPSRCEPVAPRAASVLATIGKPL